jgi:hypothetical protein
VQERKLKGFGVFAIGTGDAAEPRRHHHTSCGRMPW